MRLWDLSASLPSTLEDVQRAVEQPEQSDVPPVRRVRAGGAAGGALSALSWHPRAKQRLLLVSKDGVVEEMALHDDAVAAWHPRGELCYGLDAAIEVADERALNSDLDSRMRARAALGYGVDTDRNRAICRQRKEDDLERLWDWMAQQHGAQSDAQPQQSDGTGAPLYDGVMAALLPPDELSRFRHELHLQPPHASSVAQPSPGPVDSSLVIQPSSLVPPAKVYLSPGRVSALQRCGWFDLFTPPSSTSTLRRSRGPTVAAVNFETRLRVLEERGEYERAAMLAVFHLDLRRALQALTTGASDRPRGGGGGAHQQHQQHQQQHLASTAGDAQNGNASTSSAGGGSVVDLGLVALALAGYQATPLGSAGVGAAGATASSSGGGGSSGGAAVDGLGSSLWARTFASTVQHKAMSPHLAAVFSFLSVPHPAPSRQSLPTFHALLSSSTPLLSFRDRLAFACRFLPDADLFAFIRAQAAHAIERGELEGLLLTGLGPGSGCEVLMQQHLDASGDVQTVALLGCFAQIAHGGAAEAAEPGDRAGRFERWIRLYRGHLNQWRMWTERAQLDVARAVLHSRHPAEAAGQPRQPHPAHSPPHQHHVFARCAFCSQPLHFEAPAALRGGGPLSLPQRGPAGRRGLLGVGAAAAAVGGAEANARVRGCPHCRKSLPRCALCLVALDAALPAAGAGPGRKAAAAPASALSGWFSWCQHCRHGGHAEHLQDWFSQHQHCPVHNCQCHCSSRDAALTADRSAAPAR